MELSKIKVLIADDESIVRQGLRTIGPWERYGMEVVAEAPNGKKAYEAFIEHRPQVVITDIVMPEVNGIELATQVKQSAAETKILLLSCHRDFEYAQRGIELGASGYLLKTALNAENLGKYLDRFQTEIMMEQDKVNEDTISQKVQAWLGGFHERAMELEFSGWMAGRWRWMVEQPLVIYLIYQNDATKGAKRGKISEEIQDTLKAEYEWIDLGDKRCFLIMNAKYQQGLETELLQMKAAHPQISWQKSLCNGAPQAIMKAFEQMFHRSKLDETYHVETSEWPDPILKAVELMDQDHTRWTASEMAHAVGLSRSHFSVLFKKVTGESFMTFLYRKKLKIACDLLKHTSMTTEQISERIGLDSGKYFSKWFKRCMNATPSEYRSNFNRGG